MLRTTSLGAVLFLSTACLAQSVTIPQGLMAKEGAYSRHVPLRYNPARIQCGYGPKATGWTTPKLIMELQVRANDTAYLNTAFTVDCRVMLTSIGCDPECTSYKFAENHGQDVVTFLTRKTYNFTPFSTYPNPPAPFNIVLKGTRPFLAAQPTLLVDWTAYSQAYQTNTNFYVDAERVSGSVSGTKGTVVHYGTGCNPTNFDSFATGLNEGELLRTYCYTRNTGDTVLAWLGRARSSIPMPMTGCTLYTMPVLVFPQLQQTTNATSPLYFDWGKLPTGITGAKLCAQFAAVDTTLQNVRMSRGSEVTFGNYTHTYPFMISHRYGYGSGFDPDKNDAKYGWIDTAIVFLVK